MGASRLLACTLLLCFGAAAAQETRAYHGLWGNLFKQQQQIQQEKQLDSAAALLHTGLGRLLGRLLPGAGGDGSSADAAAAPSDEAWRHSPFNSLEDYLSQHLGGTLALLERGTSTGSGASSGSGTSGSGSSASQLERLHEALHSAIFPGLRQDASEANPQDLSAAAALHGFLLGAAAASSAAATAAGGLALHAAASAGSSGAGSSGAAGSLTAGLGMDPLPAKPVADPAWDAFKGHTCVRLQNFGNADGYNAALLGHAPCASGRSTAGLLAAAAAAASGSTAAAPTSSATLRWGKAACFMLDCSKGSEEDASMAPAGTAGNASASPMSSYLVNGVIQAASKAAASVAAAIDTRRTCRLAVSSSNGDGESSSSNEVGGGAGSGAHLKYAFERPLLGAPKLDALRLRICNLPPSSLQYPAAMVHAGTTITLSGLKLNGRPVLVAPVSAPPQAAAPDGCLQHLYRLPSKATKGGFLLSGWVSLAEGSNGGSITSGTSGSSEPLPSFSPPGSFGVGEMASVELVLGEYSLLGAATSRLLSSGAAAVAAAAAGSAQQAVQQPQQQPHVAAGA